jgi:hypothetical protein
VKKILVTAAFLAAVAVLAIVLPPARRTLGTSGSDGTVAGVLHVHSNQSDGGGTPDEIAAAAARAGLKFLILTDHGDATRAQGPPVYRSGVLCLNAVEISTTGGHYLAIDMPPAPYPLGGEASDVVEDVKRLGGFGVVAHPDSPKPALSWQDWDSPFDAIEWMNPDTSWRVHVRWTGWRTPWNVLTALATYPFRAAETMADLVGRTTLSRERWDFLAKRRRIVILAGTDAHARLGLGGADPVEGRLSVPFPGYETSFRTLSVHVRPDRPFNGDAIQDADALVRGLRRGHAYVVVDGLASPPVFQFTAGNGQETANQGDRLDFGPSTTLHVGSNAPASFTTTVWAGNRVLASSQGQPELTRRIEEPAVYRVEITAPSTNGPIAWLISNPIYVGVSYAPPSPSPEATTAETYELFNRRTSMGWWTEADPASNAQLDVVQLANATELHWRYRLSTATSGQYATLAVNTPIGRSYQWLTFTARSEGPMRLSVQFRIPGPNGDRWRKSVYVDRSPRAYSMSVNDLIPVGSTRAPHPILDSVRDVMFVVDTTHAKPGSSGQVWIANVALRR